MKIQTHLGNTIEAVDSLKARYDKNVKEILSDIQILARIVKYTVTEVKDLSIDEIMQCIDRDSIKVGVVPIQPGLTNLEKIESVQTEDAVPNEGYITYDIRFMLIIAESSLEIIINVEAQQSTDFSKLKYHIESRIVFYLARLISSQKGVNFAKSEYDNIKKVYSIWICMDTDDGEESISRISLTSDTIFGKKYDFPKLDKMCGIVIRIRNNDNVAESQNKLIAMLEDVLSSEDSDTKKRKLEEKYDMKITTELEGRFNSMCNLSNVVEEKGIKKGIEQGIEKGIQQGIEKGIEQGIEKGIEQGIEKGIRGLVDTLKELGIPKEVVVQKIMEKFSLTEEKAREFVND